MTLKITRAGFSISLASTSLLCHFYTAYRCVQIFYTTNLKIYMSKWQRQLILICHFLNFFTFAVSRNLSVPMICDTFGGFNVTVYHLGRQHHLCYIFNRYNEHYQLGFDWFQATTKLLCLGLFQCIWIIVSNFSKQMADCLFHCSKCVKPVTYISCKYRGDTINDGGK